jgi:hypothetical protein
LTENAISVVLQNEILINLKIRPDNKLETVKEIIRAFGMKPEQHLTKDAFADGVTTYNPDDYENHQLSILNNQLKQLIRREASA